MQIDTNRFKGHFMVMKKEGGEKPSKLHLSRNRAEKEASRLSEKMEGDTFLIVQIVGRSKNAEMVEKELVE